MGRPTVMYDVYKDGVFTGNRLSGAEIESTFKLSTKNLAKYSNIDGRRYNSEYNFISDKSKLNEESQMPVSFKNEWNKAVKMIKEAEGKLKPYTVYYKKDCDLGNYDIDYSTTTVYAYSKEDAIHITKRKGISIIDVTLAKVKATRGVG